MNFAGIGQTSVKIKLIEGGGHMDDPIVTYGELSFDDDGTAKGTVTDPNITAQAKERQYEALMSACKKILEQG